MKHGDLVKLVGSLFSTWSRQDEVGIVVSEDHFSEGFLVCFANDEIQDFSGYEDHFEVMNAS